jgi:hypothetical protein
MLKQKKSHSRYIFYRYYIAVVYLAVIIWGIFWILSFAADREPTIAQVIGFGVLFPCFAVAVFILMSIFVFPFNYSVLGSLERTPFPNEKPILKVTGTWGQIGVFRGTMPFFSWYIFPSGLGISILGIGKAFIPVKQMKSLNRTSNLMIWGSPYEVTHTSREINEPIYLPEKNLFEALKDLYNKSITQK